ASGGPSVRVSTGDKTAVMAFSRRDDALYGVDAKGQLGDLVRIPLDGGHEAPLLEGQQLGYALGVARALDRIAYTRVSGRTNLWRLELDGRGGVARTPLTVGTSPKSALAVSPDRSQIAFAMDDGAGTDLYLVPAAGGQPRRLTHA